MSTSQTLTERFAAGRATEETPEAMLARLVEFQPSEFPVVSLYLDARANQHGKRSYEPFVRKRMTELKRTFLSHSPELNSFTEDSVRIDRYLEEAPRPSAQGVAIFACSAANDFFDVGQFNVPFERNRLMVSDRPHLYPLARVIDRYPRYAVVAADTNSAHIFAFAAGRAIDQRDVNNLDTREPRWGGWTLNHFERHVRDFEMRHAKEVIEVLERTLREDQIDKVILAGDQQTVIPLLRQQMSKEVSNKVIDVISLGVDTAEEKILEESLKLIRRHNSLSDMEKVQRLMNEYRADDLAVAGAAQTIAALSNGQVEEMLISTNPNDLAFDAAEVNHVLRLYRPDDPQLPSLDHRSIADELVRLARQVSAAQVTFIEDANQLKQVGGVGALLRYRVSRDHATPYEESAAVAKTESLVEV